MSGVDQKGHIQENVGRQYLLIYFLLNLINLFQFLCPLAKLRIYCAVCVPGHRDVQQQQR